MTRLSALVLVAASVPSAFAGAALYAQCGGKSYTGPTKCDSGVCTAYNDYFSQCVPGPPPPPPPPVSTTTVTATVTSTKTATVTKTATITATATSISTTTVVSTATFVSTATCAPTSTTTTATSTSTTPDPTATSTNFPFPFSWNSTGPIIGPKDDSHAIAALKDPSIILVNGTYHVFVSTAVSSGYNLAYLNFTDFSDAGSAPLFYLDASSIGTGYRAAPQVFWLSSQKLWYLVYQNGNAAYSTNPDISNPAGWTAPQTFYSGEPQTIADNIGTGYWVDMWVICDDANCFLFSSDDNGHLYRSQTTLANFPAGMSEPVIAKSAASPYDLFEASNVYKVGSEYLLIVECIGANGRYFRTWTAPKIDGTWADLDATEAHPFAGANNVAFPDEATPWTKDISHGEMIRTVVDETMEITPCGMRYLYQGVNPANNTGDYNSIPWRLALLTQTSACP